MTITERDRERAAQALCCADIEQLEDGTFCGTVPGHDGVIEFGTDVEALCRVLREVLEEWYALGREIGDVS